MKYIRWGKNVLFHLIETYFIDVITAMALVIGLQSSGTYEMDSSGY